MVKRSHSATASVKLHVHAHTEIRVRLARGSHATARTTRQITVHGGDATRHARAQELSAFEAQLNAVRARREKELEQQRQQVRGCWGRRRQGTRTFLPHR